MLPFPVDVRALNRFPYVWRDFLPGQYAGMAVALHEYLGLAYYRLAYGYEG